MHTMDGVMRIVSTMKMLVYGVTEQVYPFLSLISKYYYSTWTACETNRAIRLAANSQPGSGRVEILVNNQWGTICDVFWGLTDAEVACHELGYIGALQATDGGCKFIIFILVNFILYTYIDFDEGTGPIHRNKVMCQGFEPNLFACPAEFNTSSCDHSLDAGVICISKLLQ